MTKPKAAQILAKWPALWVLSIETSLGSYKRT